MKTLACLVALCGSLAVTALATMQGQGPGPGPGGPPPSEGLVARMMAFDADKDGKLLRSEVTDDRLQGLFDRADADKDGAVTRQELAALEAREQGQARQGGFGGPGGPGRMGPPRLGDVLPMFVRQVLHLSADQQKQVDALQKDVDAKLAEILDDDQEKQFQQMKERGPGGPGGPGGRTKGAPRPPQD